MGYVLLQGLHLVGPHDLTVLDAFVVFEGLFGILGHSHLLLQGHQVVRSASCDKLRLRTVSKS